MSFHQFRCNDLTDSRWYFNRAAIHSVSVSSLPQQGGGVIHTFTLNLLPTGEKELTAIYDTVEVRDTELERFLYSTMIEDKLTPAIRAERERGTVSLT